MVSFFLRFVGLLMWQSQGIKKKGRGRSLPSKCALGQHYHQMFQNTLVFIICFAITSTSFFP